MCDCLIGLVVVAIKQSSNQAISVTAGPLNDDDDVFRLSADAVFCAPDAEA